MLACVRGHRRVQGQGQGRRHMCMRANVLTILELQANEKLGLSKPTISFLKLGLNTHSV